MNVEIHLRYLNFCCILQSEMNSFGPRSFLCWKKVFRRNVPGSTDILQNQALKPCPSFGVNGSSYNACMTVIVLITAHEQHPSLHTLNILLIFFPISRFVNATQSTIVHAHQFFTFWMMQLTDTKCVSFAPIFLFQGSQFKLGKVMPGCPQLILIIHIALSDSEVLVFAFDTQIRIIEPE
jgi:hypothetical protein